MHACHHQGPGFFYVYKETAQWGFWVLVLVNSTFQFLFHVVHHFVYLAIIWCACVLVVHFGHLLYHFLELVVHL